VLTQSVLTEPGYAVGVELCAALLLGAAIIWLAPILSPVLLLVFGIAIIVLALGASWYFYVQDRLLLDFTYPLFSSALVYLTLVFSNYASEQAQRRRIRSAFGQYLSPSLVEQLAQSPEKLVLGGEEREMSILFSDVRGFTTISELYKDDPQGLTSLMNSFLTPLTNAIIEYKGTIDKYMGDAVMAFWNAPLNDANHEQNACDAALEMLHRVDTLNREREQQAKETGQRFIPIKVGVGINTGKCVVGNMGSDLRFNYSVLGDPVNLASRLEGQSKTYGLSVIIGSKTASGLRDKFAVLEFDRITVKGKTEPESVFTVLGRADVASNDQFRRLRDAVAEMLSCYRQRNFAGAAKSIIRCREFSDGFGLDGLFELYSERISSYEKDPPPADWNGVAVLETK
jgi:adenylate cyclase